MRSVLSSLSKVDINRCPLCFVLTLTKPFHIVQTSRDDTSDIVVTQNYSICDKKKEEQNKKKKKSVLNQEDGVNASSLARAELASRIFFILGLIYRS